LAIFRIWNKKIKLLVLKYKIINNAYKNLRCVFQFVVKINKV